MERCLKQECFSATCDGRTLATDTPVEVVVGSAFLNVFFSKLEETRERIMHDSWTRLCVGLLRRLRHFLQKRLRALL